MTFTAAALKQHPTSDGVAFVADIRLDGRKVGTVEQDGRGGCNRYRFESAAVREQFTAAAAAAHPDETVEVEDVFTERLVVALEMNRRRSVSFLLDGDDFYGKGEYRTVKAGPGNDLASVREWLRREHGSRNPLVWDKTVSGWVAA